MKFHVRAYVDNPGGAYDPAPLHEFDEETDTLIPMVGDKLRWDETGTTYEVIARHFDYSCRHCVLEVKEAASRWPWS